MPLSNELPAMLLKSLKLEYETTNISDAELLKKYNLVSEQVPFSEWNRAGTASVIVYTEDTECISSNTSSIDTYNTSTSINTSNNDSDTKAEDDSAKALKTSINTTAKNIVTKISSILIEDIDLTPKDLKEMAAALVSVKESTIGKDPTIKIDVTSNTQINVINQLVNAIKGVPSDC